MNAPARKRLPPAERRAQLLEHALVVFARRGLGRAGHAEVARDAGVAVSTAFLYFPTRQNLVDAVLDEVERFYLDMAFRLHAEEKPAPDVLLEHGHAFRESIDSHPHHARIFLDWSTAFRDEIWPRYVAFVERLVENHAATIRRGQEEGSVAADVDPETSARMIVGLAQMIARLKMTRFDPEKLSRIGRTLVTAALNTPAQDS